MVEDGGGVIGLLPLTAELVVLSNIIVTMSLFFAFSGDVKIGEGFGSPAATSLNSAGVKVPMVDPLFEEARFKGIRGGDGEERLTLPLSLSDSRLMSL